LGIIQSSKNNGGNDVDMNDPNVQKNILAAIIVLILMAVITTLSFSYFGWKVSLGVVVLFFIAISWLGRP